MTIGMLPKTVFIVVLTSILVACGGGGGGSGDTLLGPPVDSGGNEPVPVINLFLRAPDGTTDISSLEGTETGRLMAQVLDGSGNAVSGVVVNFSSDLGQISPDNATALSDASGFAEVILGAGSVSGAGTATASASVETVVATSNTVGFETDGLGSGAGFANFIVAPLDLSTETGSLTISRDNEGTVTAIITTVDGSPPEDEILVEFTTSRGTLSESAVFAEEGIASTTLRAGITAGSGVVSAMITIGSETQEATPKNFVSAGDSVPTIVLSVPVAAMPSATASTPVEENINAANPVEVTATVRDSLGNLTQGSVVQFSLNGDGRLTKDSDITNASGSASTTIMAGTTPGFGEVTAIATVLGESVASGVDNVVNFITDGDEPFSGEGNSNLSIAIVLDTNGNPADTGEREIDADTPGTLLATVLQADGSPSVDTVVLFEIAGGIGDLFPINGLTLTNSAGVAGAALTAGSVPGAGAAKASIVIDGSTFNSDSLNYTSLGNAGDAVIVLSHLFSDATPGNGSNIITVSEPAIITVTVEDDVGVNLPNRSVIVVTSLGTVSIDGSTPGATASGISDFEGKIRIDLAAGSTFGPATVAVTVGDTSEIIAFEVGVDGLQIGICSGIDPTDCSGGATFTSGTLAVGTSPLSAGGTSTVSLVVLDANNAVVPNIEIGFTSVCAGEDPPVAEISKKVISDNSGVVVATYLDKGCARPADIITAIEASSGLTASGEIEVLSATIGSIRFESVNPANIQIKGTGTSTANVTFEVLDVQGGFVEDVSVNFELTTTVGGLALVSPTGLTDSNGKAIATVNAGLIPTTVRVRASVVVNGTTLETLSDGLSINTGVPDQNSMSITASVLNMEGEGFDGIISNITVRMADAFNNPVPDGTTIQFRTEYGSIQPACNTVGGACSVNFQSAEPRRPISASPDTKLVTGNCPTPLIVDELADVVDIVGTDAFTNFVPSTIYRVELEATGAMLAETTDYVFATAGDGIECVSATCTSAGLGVAGVSGLAISYSRMYLDEIGGTDGMNNPAAPNISNPGVATAPFVQKSSIPCLANPRARSAVVGAYQGGLGQVYGGRSTILAFAQGEESFVDKNGNGQYDLGETFIDIPEAILDINEDDVFGNFSTIGAPSCYDSLDRCFESGGLDEIFIDFNQNGQFTLGNGKYNGTLCPENVPINVCTRELVNIRKDIVVVMSGSNVFASLRDSVSGEYIARVDLSGAGPGSFMFTANVPVNDNEGVSIPAGTAFAIGWGVGQVPRGIGETASLTSGIGSVTLDISDEFSGRLSTGTTIGVAQGTDGCQIVNSPGGTLADSNGNGSFAIGISLASVLNPVSGSAPITTTVTTSKGLISSFAFNCNY